MVENEQVYTSTRRGVKPLVVWYESNKDSTSFSAADKVIVWITIQLSLSGITETPFTLGTLFTEIVFHSIPEIILQLIVIPLIIFIYNKKISCTREKLMQFVFLYIFHTLHKNDITKSIYYIHS